MILHQKKCPPDKWWMMMHVILKVRLNPSYQLLWCCSHTLCVISKSFHGSSKHQGMITWFISSEDQSSSAWCMWNYISVLPSSLCWHCHTFHQCMMVFCDFDSKSFQGSSIMVYFIRLTFISKVHTLDIKSMFESYQSVVCYDVVVFCCDSKAFHGWV